MPRFLTDTSCMVAAVCGWHEHHRRAATEIERRLDKGEDLFVAAAGLVELYAVLTRLPPPHRLSPSDAKGLVAANFMDGMAQIVALGAGSYKQVLDTAPERNIAGGAIYDAVIMASALAAHVDVLLTFNDRQFRSLADLGVEIVVPD
jgi:predicted nucleic acid-binding protein